MASSQETWARCSYGAWAARQNIAAQTGCSRHAFVLMPVRAAGKHCVTDRGRCVLLWRTVASWCWPRAAARRQGIRGHARLHLPAPLPVGCSDAQGRILRCMSTAFLQLQQRSVH